MKQPAILHIGNVANNAYNVAKVLRSAGLENHVLSCDYYHINSQPAWEDGEFDANQIGDQYFPRLPSRFDNGFEPPRWYFQGPRVLTCLRLVAINEEKPLFAALLEGLARLYLRLLPSARFRKLTDRLRLIRLLETLCLDLFGGCGRANTLGLVARGLGRLFGLGGAETANSKPKTPYAARVATLVDSYRRRFPERSFDRSLLMGYKPIVPLMQRLFDHYDVVIGYGAEGILPLLAGKPYIAYEYGTIRNLPFEDSATGRLVALAYTHSTQTIVTNSDNRQSAERLGRDYFFLPHTVNESWAPDLASARDLRDHLVRLHGGDFFVFHPPRQHWSQARDTTWEKGNDHLFRGFAAFVSEHAPGARCIAVAWGQTLEASRALVRELGIDQQVAWIAPQPNISMMRYISACDVVADQFTIPTPGGIPPKAFLAGKPVISAFDPQLHSWCYPEMPPILPACSADEVAAALRRLYTTPGLAERTGRLGRRWYRQWNSNRHVLSVLTEHLQPGGAGS